MLSQLDCVPKELGGRFPDMTMIPTQPVENGDIFQRVKEDEW